MTDRGMKGRDDTPTLREAAGYAWRLLLLIKPFWSRLVRGLALGFVLGLFGLGIPYLTKLFVDDVYPSQDVALMHVLVAAVAGISIATGLAFGFSAHTAIKVFRGKFRDVNWLVYALTAVFLFRFLYLAKG